MTTPLWAPWRMEYIREADRPAGCIFCDKPAEAPERRAGNLVLAVQPRAFVMMNRYPYAYGHVMIAPRAHVASLASLDRPSFDDLWRLVRDSIETIETALAPHGLNVGMNLGRVAGAGIEGHLHVHVVPRWLGDTNFMPALADVRVMPEHLAATYERLRGPFARLSEAAAVDGDSGESAP